MNDGTDNRLGESRQTFAHEAGNSAPGKKQYRAKVFKSGNSLALRLPAELRLSPGLEMLLTVEGEMAYSLAPLDPPKRKFNIAKVWGCAAGSGLKFIEPEDRLFEERPLLTDDPEWCARHMPER